MFKVNQKRIIKLTAAAIAVAMVGVGSVACSKPDTIKSYEYETSTYKEQVIKDIDSNVKESAQNSKVEIDLNKNEVNIEKTNENNIKNEQNNANNELLSNNVLDNANNNANSNVNKVNTGYKEYKEGDPKPITDDVNDYKDWLDAQNGHPQGTDRYGNPFKKEGADYTWSDSGEPNEAPTDGDLDNGVENPNTGVKYKYGINYGWKVDNTDEINAEAKRMNDLMNYGGVDEKTGEVYRKLTPEELKEISAMYSASFK